MRRLEQVRQPLATRQEVAEYLGVPLQTLERWAHDDSGPTYRIVGRHARYRWSDVESWLDKQKAGGEPAA